MNKVRRKDLMKALELLAQAKEIIESVCDEESEAYENLPESLQSSERGEQMDEYIGTMKDVMDTIDEMTESLEEITEGQKLKHWS